MRDADGFDAFYAGSVRRITGQLYAMTGDKDQAEECVQEAFARAWQRWGSVSGFDDPEAWVRTVAYRISVDTWRRALRRTKAYRRHGVPEDTPGITPDSIAIMSALRQIPDAQRRAIVLYHLVGLPVGQVADETGVPAGTVKARLARGRQALATLLSDPPHGGGATSEGVPSHA
ncbi:MAG TPA: SigE family RNA polymerase sigma factor [Streptosporangiaceae bacterium]|nr:SigE family RNA polymerase sigma factor [Streptosporangiaceae bacterium]